MTATIGFIGLGRMGLPMASQLVKAGHRVCGFDVSDSSLQAAEREGLTVAHSASEAVSEAEVVITMLPEGHHVLSVYYEGGVLEAAPSGAVFIESSTIDVPSSLRAHALAQDSGFLSLDAPVSGGVMGARQGILTFLVGGEEEAYKKALPFLRVMGRAIVHCGPQGKGQIAKMCNNMVLGISMLAVSEAFNLGKSLGLAPQALFDVMSQASGQCWSLTKYCPEPGLVPTSPANEGYKGGFSSALLLKDLKLSQSAAQEGGVSTPLGAQAEILYQMFVNSGHADTDFSGVIAFLKGKGKT